MNNPHSCQALKENILQISVIPRPHIHHASRNIL